MRAFDDRLRARRHASRLALALLCAILGSGCGRTPAGPSGVPPPVPTPAPPTSPSPGQNVTGTVLDGISGLAVSGATVTVDGVGQATSAANGFFGLTSDLPGALRAVVVVSPTTVDRSTWADLPGPPLTLPLMPSALDLAAFDQMFRGNGGALHRWVAAPPLVVQTRVLRFSSFSATYEATDIVMTAQEVEELIQDLRWTLPQLTGDTFGDFGRIETATAAEGDSVTVSRSGSIVVARFQGLTSALDYWGYARWAWNGVGQMSSGTIMLDSSFETSGSQYRRSLRAHELGHALGYNHVTTMPSVMHSSARFEPNEFDRGGARIAFQRPPLNRSPDADPVPAAQTTAARDVLTWAEAP